MNQVAPQVPAVPPKGKMIAKGGERMDLEEERSYIKANYDVDEPIHMRDSKGRRWCCCIHCGELKPTDDMLIYGGTGRSMNRGECRLCLYHRGFLGKYKP
jgi:hypothetical protein